MLIFVSIYFIDTTAEIGYNDRMNPNLVEDGKKTQFSSTNQPKKKVGRRPTRWKQLCKEYDLSSDDKRNLARMLLSVKSKKEIEQLLKDEKIPYGVYCAGIAMMTDARKFGGRGFLKYIFDAAYGENPKTVDINVNDITKKHPLDRNKMLEDFKKEVIEEYEKEKQKDNNDSKK